MKLNIPGKKQMVHIVNSTLIKRPKPGVSMRFFYIEKFNGLYRCKAMAIIRKTISKNSCQNLSAAKRPDKKLWFFLIVILV